MFGLERGRLSRRHWRAWRESCCVCTRRYVMQAMLASIVGHVAEMGVFFVAAAALTAGALALR